MTNNFYSRFHGNKKNDNKFPKNNSGLRQVEERNEMRAQEIKNVINQYFDNELTKGEEVLLFTQLSEDDEAREYFKQMNLLRTTSEQTLVEYPDVLDTKILSKLQTEEIIVRKKWNNTSSFAVISYGLALVLLTLSIFLYTESIQYRNKLDLTDQRINQQNQLIQVLYNTLPQTEVVEKVENEIIVTSEL